jgi:hypothetical protein
MAERRAARPRLGLLLTILVAGLAVFAGRVSCDDPPLSEVVAKEKARREAERAKGKAIPKYTDEDLKHGQKKKTEEAQPSEAQGEGAASSAEGSDAGSGASDNDEWRRRVQDQREVVSKLEAQIHELEAKIGELRADNGLGRATDVNRQRSVQQEVAAALDEIETVKETLATEREKADALIEEARQAGVPYSQLE